jgi:hypothetical protein
MTCARCHYEFCWVCYVDIHECVTYHFYDDDDDDRYGDDDDDDDESRGSAISADEADDYFTMYSNIAALDAR